MDDANQHAVAREQLKQLFGDRGHAGDEPAACVEEHHAQLEAVVLLDDDVLATCATDDKPQASRAETKDTATAATTVPDAVSDVIQTPCQTPYQTPYQTQ